jgi:mono/diheme cytochrome c family protein
MKKALVVALALAVLLPLSAFADGAAVYKAKCTMCHGADGAGQTPVGKNMKLKHLGAPEVQKLSDAEMIKLITDGKGKMPGYKGKLSDDDIKAVVAFVRTLKK